MGIDTGRDTLTGSSADADAGKGRGVPVLRDLDTLVREVEADPALTVRYAFSPTDEHSRDGESGLDLPGVSVNPLTPEDWWTRPVAHWVARQLCQYRHLREDEPGRAVWVLSGRVVARGPDSEPLLSDPTVVARLDDHVLDEAEQIYEEEFERGHRPGGGSPPAGGWRSLVNPSAAEVRELRESLGIHPLALADVENGRTYPMIAGFDAHLVITAGDITADGQDAGQLTIVIGRDEIATVQSGEPSALRDLGAVIRSAGPGEGPPAAAYRILEAVAADYVAVAEGVEAKLDEAETEVFDKSVREDFRRIYDLRKEIGRIARAVSGLSEAFDTGGGAIDRFLEFDRDLIPYFRHLHGTIRAAHRLTADQDAALDAVVSSHESNVSTGQNTDMRTISAVAALVAVPSLVAALYGMNFSDLPLLDQAGGWAIVVGATVVLDVAAYILFRRRNWIP